LKPILAKSTLRTAVAITALLAGVGGIEIAGHAQGLPPASPPIWTVPEIGALPYNDHGRLVRQGRDLVTATYAHIGPEVADPAKRYAGNNLACVNCHLQAGTKKFGLALYGIYGDFPEYSKRSGTDVSLEERLNSCMVRSMNGRPMPNDVPEMRALVAYIKFLSTGVPPGEKLPGLGTGSMPELNRAAGSWRGGLHQHVCRVSRP
jgi:thiosulfate dehydrogenase